MISWNFEDIIKIQEDRVSPFPNFLMDWVNRQIEEIVNKLTDFPSLFLVLPDFDGIMDTDWSNLWPKLDKAEKEWEDKEKEKGNQW